MSEKSRVQINYRSGISMVVECDEFTISRSKFNNAKSIEWAGAEPDPMWLGIEDIESVWQLS
jgi:hypothetical protein